MTLKKPEDVPRDGVFRMLVSHAGFALTAQDRFKALSIIRICPEKVLPRVGIHVRQTTASGMHFNMMHRAGACLDAAAHRAGIVSSEAEFRDTEWGGSRHGAKCTRYSLTGVVLGRKNKRIGCIIPGKCPGAELLMRHVCRTAAAGSNNKGIFHVKRTIGWAAICVLLLGVSIQAQAPQGPPKPGPEVKKLAYFVGNWKEEGKSMAHGMSGPISSTQKWEWTSGGFFVVGHSDNKSPVGEFTIMAVLGYDPQAKMYTYNVFDSWGEAIVAKGTVSGDTWTWTTEMMMEGKPMKSRLTFKEVSKAQYTCKYESSTDGGSTWTPEQESTFTKVTAAAP
jgi:hypothetical protein